MHQQHPNFIRPETEKIWRYMTFTKFVSILEKNELFFTRADKFEDPFEGTYSRANLNKENRNFFYPDESIDSMVIEQVHGHIRWLRQFMLISCWHVNEVESDAMWKLYLRSGEGIAIQSTYSRLSHAFNDTKENVFIGKVRYRDNDRDWTPEGNLFAPFLEKRNHFIHEQELRAVIDYSLELGENKLPEAPFRYGLGISVDVETLIENIYVSPTAPAWFADLVDSVTKKYGLNKTVIHSELLTNPY